MVDVVSNMHEEVAIAVALTRMEGKLDVMAEQIRHANSLAEADRTRLAEVEGKVEVRTQKIEERLQRLEDDMTGRKSVAAAAKTVYTLVGVTVGSFITYVAKIIGVGQ